jgi:predicted nucleotidyltransferase
MSSRDEIYTRIREVFLQALTERLAFDERFVAAWLIGSFARQQQDALSDIDITLVVSDEQSRTLCARPKMLSAQTTNERYDLFSVFGKPTLIHENNYNAPEGGTFTFVAYDHNAIMVDWILRPLTGAHRPADARLLFDKANVPVHSPTQPEGQGERAEAASERTAFFWMMADITVKYVYRGDGVFVNCWLEELTKLVSEVERLTKGQPSQYERGSYTKLSVTPQEQIAAIRRLCGRMESLKHEVLQLGGQVSESTMPTVEALISIAQEKTGTE